MKLLAIDTSTEIASVAVSVGDELFSLEQGAQKTHAQLILPMIEQVMSQAKVTLAQLDGIVFGCGPGSFTGLRIACSIAKGLAYAHNLKLYPVSSLSAIESAVRQQEKYKQEPVLVVLDARMQELYWRYFLPHPLQGEDNISAPHLINLPDKKPLVIAGVGIDEYWPQFSDAIKARVITKLHLFPKACDMLGLAKQMQPIKASDAQPIYIRNQVTQGKAGG